MVLFLILSSLKIIIIIIIIISGNSKPFLKMVFQKKKKP